MNVRHTIFLSSTFRDLQEERQVSLNAILALGYFPIGMEVFPAANSTPWDLIKTLIADADYYVLIIAGKYGSETSEGLSYTEKEYDLAVELKKPILSFLHADIASLRAEKVERTDTANEKLRKFREKVLCRHLCKQWQDKHELGLYITQSLLQATKENPAKGWVRNDYNVTSLLNDINNYRTELDKLRLENSRLRQLVPNEETTKFTDSNLTSLRFTKDVNMTSSYEIQLPWNVLFQKIAPYLMYPIDFPKLLFSVAGIVREHLKTSEDWDGMEDVDSIRVLDESLQYVLKYFLAHDLIDRKTYDVQNENGTHVSIVTKWFLTKKGEKIYLNQFFNIQTYHKTTELSS